MKERLNKIFEESKNKYAVLLKAAKAKSVTEKWGMGVLPPVTLEPFAAELLGYSPGKWMKKPSAPGKNRFRYLYDANDNILLLSTYTDTNLSGKWLHSNQIFTHDEGSILMFEFAAAAENAKKADLNKVTYATFENNRISATHTYWNDANYTENHYKYKDDKIVGISMRLWYRAYIEREFELEYSGDTVLITEVTGGKRTQTFPRC